MKNLDTTFITTNILKLIDYAGITDIAFANLINISVRHLKRIRKREADFNPDHINKAAQFFIVPIQKLNSQEIEYEYLYRIKLAKKHKNNSEYASILNGRPSITYAIAYVLIYDEKFRNEGLVTGDIQDLFARIGWSYSSSYISSALERNRDLVEIAGCKIERGKKVNIYRALRSESGNLTPAS